MTEIAGLPLLIQDLGWASESAFLASFQLMELPPALVSR